MRSYWPLLSPLIRHPVRRSQVERSHIERGQAEPSHVEPSHVKQLAGPLRPPARIRGVVVSSGEHLSNLEGVSYLAGVTEGVAEGVTEGVKVA